MKGNTETVTATEETAVVAHGHGNAIAKASTSSSLLQVIDVEEGIPDMENVERVPLDLASDYWSPESPGETKRLVFSHFSKGLVPDKYGPSKGANGEMVELECAHFFEMVNGEVKTIRQGSKVLLPTLRNHGIQTGTLLEIVYTGKVKLSNGNTGDGWAVYPLKTLPPKK